MTMPRLVGTVIGCLILGCSIAHASGVPEPGFDRGLSAVEDGGPVPILSRPQPDRVNPRTFERGVPAGTTQLAVPAEFGVLLEFDGTRQQLEAAGLRVCTQAGRLFTARVRPDEIGLLRAIPGLRRARLARYSRTLLDVSAVDVRADIEHDATGSPPRYLGRAGQGVIVGLVDSGIDFTLPDFKDKNGKTRVVALWDQTDALGPHPAGFAYGTEWSRTQIDASPAYVRQVDVAGHGTLVAGILCGNGLSTGCEKSPYRYIGIAPLADIIAVKTDLSDTGIIDGVNFEFQRAAALGRDCVINISLGSQTGPHDGSGDMSRAISALTGPGRVVVAAAGNDGGLPIHGQLVTSSTTPGVDRFVVNAPPYTAKPGTQNDYFIVTGWYDIAANVTIRIRGPRAADTLSAGVGAAREINTPDGKIVIIHQATALGFGGTTTSREFEVAVYDSIAANAPAAGDWEIDAVADGAADFGRRVDIWMPASWLGDQQSAAVTVGGDPSTLVGEPADGDSVIAVGAYATKLQWRSCAQASACHFNGTQVLGAIAPFSSIGPRPDGVLKPELCAPGMGVASTHSHWAPAIQVCGDADDGVHELAAGTSFSSPHVAGAAALFLQSMPGAPPSAIRQAFETHARTDASTGIVPNWTWGYGKLDVFGSISHTSPSIAVTVPDGGEVWLPGVDHSITWVGSGANAVAQVDIDYSLQDRRGPWIELLHGAANTGTLTWTVPTTLSDSVVVRIVARDNIGRESTAWSGRFRIATALAPPLGVELAIQPIVPNPGHGATPIRFSVPAPGRAAVIIVGVDGRRVWSQTVEASVAGGYAVNWNGLTDSGHATRAGVYFVRLSCAQGARTARLVLLP